MRHLPSIEALSDVDDRRLAAELELRAVLEELARVRQLVEKASVYLATVVVGEAKPVSSVLGVRDLAAFRRRKRRD